MSVEPRLIAPAGSPSRAQTDGLRLPVAALPGLDPDSLGLYLACLGLLSFASHRWASLRGSFRNGTFHLIGGPVDIEELITWFIAPDRNQEWQRYSRDWKKAQQVGNSEQRAQAVLLYRAECTEEQCELLDAHMVPGARLHFNPLLGSGGNSGRRDFAKGWTAAHQAMVALDRQEAPSLPSDELRRFLTGAVSRGLSDWSSGSWFSMPVPPWAMLLASEGLRLFAGTPSRRLGANAPRLGAFPFVTRAAAPVRESETDRSVGEVWAPLWTRPMTMAEVISLFGRGRAEVAGRSATSPGAFAAAIMQRGVDAGIEEFRRFLLVHTTSSNTFESTLGVVVPVRQNVSQGTAEAVERAIQFREALPRDQKKGKGWEFHGLSGPIDEALIALAAEPKDLERAGALLDALRQAVGRVDNRRAYRERELSFRLLPTSWLDELLRANANPAPTEFKIAAGIASILGDNPGSPTEDKVQPLIAYRLGVTRKFGSAFFSKEVPPRRVFSSDDLLAGLAAVMRRRLVDWEGDRGQPVPPFVATWPVSVPDVAAFLGGNLDEELLLQWIDRLILFDWRRPKIAPHRPRVGTANTVFDGTTACWGFLKALFHADPMLSGPDGRPLFEENAGAIKPTALRRIAALLDTGDINGALEAAQTRYQMARRLAFKPEVDLSSIDAQRLLAALLIPVQSSHLEPLVARWLPPPSSQNKENAE